MAKEIIWAATAETEKIEILSFWITHNQSHEYSIKLNDLIDNAVELLPYYPFIGRKTDYEKIRVIIVEKCLIFYEVTATQILILSICDGRQDPDRIQKRLQ